MGEPDATDATLSATCRRLTFAAGVLYLGLGVPLFFAPAWSAEQFPWAVSDFVAQSIGGWCFGTAVVALLAARIWRWSVVHPLLVFLWVFAWAELAVAAYHRDGLILDVALAWPYLITLGVSALAAVVGVVDWLRLRPAVEPVGAPLPAWVRVGIYSFVGGLTLLTVAALRARESALNGRVFPEEITPFTVRAFGVFYLALAVGALPLIRTRGKAPLLAYDLAGETLVVPITLAAFLHWDLFDFGDHPLNALYVGAYLAVGLGAGITLAVDRTWVAWLRRE